MKTIRCVILAMILSTLLVYPSMSVFATDLQEKIDTYVEAHKDTTAAVSIGVFTKDSVLFEKSYGYANIEDNLQNNTDTVIEWGSSSKLFAWVSVMQLVEQGKLDLDADIRTYLPEGFLTKLRYKDKITLTHLMNHTGGWQESSTELFVDSPQKLRTLEDALKVIEPTQVYRPGEVSAYSNFGASLAGYIVERVSGEPFYEYVNKNIFAPLGMKHTSIKPDRLDNPWVQSERQKLNCYTADMKPMGKMDYYVSCYPAGSAVGTISDYLTFGQALLSDSNGGTVLFSKPQTLTEFYTPTDYYPDGTPRNLHGMYTLPLLAGNGTGHAGNTFACSSNLLLDLDRGLGVVVMTNQKEEKVYNYGLMEEIFGRAQIKTEENLLDPSPVTGVYKLSRSYEAGIQKIMSILNYFTVSKNDDGSINVGVLGKSISFEQVKPGVFLYSHGSNNQLWYADYGADGKVMALNTLAATDLVRTSRAEYVIGLLSIALLFVAVLYSLVYLIAALIRIIRKKKSPLNAWRLALCGSILLTILNLFIYLRDTQTCACTPTSIMITGILFLLLGIVPVAYASMIAIKWKTFDFTKMQKAGLVINSVIGLCLTFNVFYWQLWMFWV